MSCCDIIGFSSILLFVFWLVHKLWEQFVEFRSRKGNLFKFFKLNWTEWWSYSWHKSVKNLGMSRYQVTSSLPFSYEISSSISTCTEFISNNSKLFEFLVQEHHHSIMFVCSYKISDLVHVSTFMCCSLSIQFKSQKSKINSD